MRYSVNDIALWLINRDNSETDKKDPEPLGLLKLNKLLYYCQGAYLAIFDKPLFDAVIQAWEFGPVVPKVYKAFKGIEPKEIYKHQEVLCGREIKDQGILDVLELVYLTIAKNHTAYQLVTITHQERPWLQATQNATVLRNQIISNDSIRDYFKENYIRVHDKK